MKLTWLCLFAVFLFASQVWGQEIPREILFEYVNEFGELEKNNKLVWRYQGQIFEEKLNYSWVDNSWKLKSHDQYWLNPAGFITKHISRIYSEDFSRIFLESTLDIEYLADTLETKSYLIRKVYEEKTSIYQSETARTYTENGLPGSQSYRIKETVNSPWSGGKTEYTYNQNGCLTKTVSSTLADDTWVPNFAIAYENDDQCRETLRTSYSFVDGAEKEGNATLTTYDDDPQVSRITKFIRSGPNKAWQFDHEREERTVGDSTIRSRINNELTFRIRWTESFFKGLKVKETAAIAYANQNDFRLTNLSVYTYQDTLLTSVEWEERNPDEANVVTGQGRNSYTYNNDGQVTLYESEFTRNGTSSYYAQRKTYRCDGLSETVSDANSLITTTYYSDPPCDGKDFEQALIVYPNPAQDDLRLYSQDDITDAQVDVLDMSGKTLLKTRLDGPAYDHINISSLSPGIYIVRIRTNDSDKSLRFIKNQ